MPGYVALPAYRAPSALDFSGLNEGIDEFNKQFEKNRLLREAQAVGAALAPGTATQTPQNPLLAPSNVPASPAQASAAAAGRIIGAESGGDPNASNPNSSAAGAGQFINSTWLDTVKRNRPDLASGKSDAEILSLRSNPNLSREMTGAYAAQNSKLLQGAGFASTPGNTYLAHFAGPGGASAVLRADPSTPVTQILSPAAVAANPHIANMTAGDLRSWADRKMGGAPATSAQAQAAPAPSGPNYRKAAAKAFEFGNVALGTQFLQQQQELDNTAYARSHQAQQEATAQQQWQAGHGLQLAQNTRAEAAAGREKTAFEDAQHKEAIARTGALAAAVAAEPDPARQTSMWKNLVAMDPEIAQGLQQHGIDPSDVASGTRFMINLARGPVTPKLTEVSPGATLYDENGRKAVFTAPAKPAEVKFNESQLTSSNFANMMVTANQKLEAMSPKDALGARLTDASGNPVPMENPKGFFGAVRDAVVPFEDARNYITPNDTQKYNQNAAQWIRAKLRKESGASIPPAEMAQEFATYFPQYGDGPETIKQKADSRAEATKGMIAQAGGAYEHYFVKGGDQPAASGAKPQASRPAQMPEGARKAPDGNWYVEQNGQFFRVDP